MEANFSIPQNRSEVVFYDSTTPRVIWIFLVVVLFITFVLGVIGNGLVIYVDGFRMACTVMKICYLNLALADFSYMASLPFQIISIIMNGEWPFGNNGYKETMNSIHTWVNPASTLASFISCLKPILYVFLCQQFRKRLIHSLPASLERALREDSVLNSDKVKNFSSHTKDSEP